MKANNVKETKVTSLADRYSVGHKAISVALSVVLLGFGWPAVNPSEVYAEDAAVQTQVATSAQAETDAAPATSASTDASAAQAATPATQAATDHAQSAAPATSTEATTSSANNANNAASNATSNAATQAPAASAPAATDAEQPSSYDIALALNNASLKTVTANATDAQVVNPPASKLTVPVGKDFKFTVTAANGYKLDKVALTSAGVERALTADANGIYTIAAADLTTGMSLTLATSEDVKASDDAAADAVSIESIDGGAAVRAASSATEISGPTSVLQGDTIKLTYNGDMTIDNWYGGDGLFSGWEVSSDKKSITLTATDNWAFNGSSKTATLYLGYIDKSGTWHTGDNGIPYQVTVKKRSFTIVQPEVKAVGEDCFWLPQIKDNETGKIIDLANAPSGSFYPFEYYYNGQLLNNQTQYYHDSELFKKAGSYKVVIKPNSGWIYDFGGQSEIEITIPTEGDDEQPSLSLTGPDTVEQFNTIDLTATLTPSQDGGTYSWSSNNENILTVDQNGKVTGVSKGTATVTVTWTSADGKTTLTATHDVTVTQTTQATTDATFYYLNDPSVPLDETSQTGKWTNLGNGKVNLAGLNTGRGGNFPQDNGNTKIYNAADRVVSWPDGSTNSTYSVARDSQYWNDIINQYKSVIQSKLPGAVVTDDDIESITLAPYKLTNNNPGPDSTNIHVDCAVEIVCKSLHTVNYYISDPTVKGTTGFVKIATDITAREGDTTNVADLVGDFDAKYPKTKTVDGVTYTLSSWSLDQALTSSVTLPYTVGDTNLDFYAKYIAGRQVMYNLDGGTWGNGAATNYAVDEGSTYTVLGKPTKAGYEFAGWTVDGLGDTKSVESGEQFTMPGNNVTITATWKAASTKVTVNYLWGDESSNQLIESADLKGYHFGDTVRDFVRDIGGYTPKSNNKTAVVLKNTDENVINVYYYKNVTLTAKSSEGTQFVYNGKEQSIDGYTSSIGDAKFKDVTASGSGTDAGDYPVTFNDGAKGKVSTDGKYIVAETVNGKLHIEAVHDAITVEITGHNESHEYSGATQTASGYDVAISSGNGNGKKYSADFIDYNGDASVSATDVKLNGTGSVTSYPMGLDASKFVNKASKNYTNVTFKVKSDGGLTITPKPVTLKSADLTKEYDGTPLTNGDTALETNEGFVEGQGVTCTFTGSQTLVNSSDNTFTYEANANTNLNNYKVTSEFGELTVTDRANKYNITVVANSNNVPMYTGGEYSAKGFETTTFDFDGATFAVLDLSTSDPKAKNAGSYDNVVSGTAKVIDADGNDVTNQFNVTTQNGVLTIGKRNVTLTSGTDVWQYDGAEHTKHTVNVSGDGFISTDEPQLGDYEFDASSVVRDYTGQKVENKFKLKDSVANSSQIKTNYNIEYKCGTLEITQNEAPVIVTVQMNSDDKPIYDGEEHSVSGYAVKSVTANGKDIASAYDAANSIKFNGAPLTKTDAGTYTYTASAKTDFENTNAAYKDVTFVVNDGQLVIDKRDVTMASASDEKVYDGTPLTNNKVTADGFVDGQGATYNVTGSQINVGSSNNTFTYTLNEGTDANNYNIKEPIYGTLKVTEQSIDPETNKDISVEAPADVMYNGKNQYGEPVVKSGNTVLVKDRDYTLSYDGQDVKNAGTVTVTIEGKGNYAGKTTTSYKITKRSVRLVSADGSWTYDGQSHSQEIVTVDNNYDGFVEGEGATYSNYASVKDVTAAMPNTFDYALNDNTRAANYDISQAYGKLVVSAQSISKDDGDAYAGIVINDPSNATYDGAEHKWAPTVTDANGNALAEGTDYTVSYDKTDFTDAGTITVTITGIGNYTGTVVKTYQITPRSVTLKGEKNVTKVYDGKPLTAEKVTVGGDGFVEGEATDIKAIGSVTDVTDNPVDNPITFTEGKAFKAGNYAISTEPGTLRVTPRSIDDVEYGMSVDEPGSVKYDGTEHKWAPTVKNGDAVLGEGDYDVAYSTDDFTNATGEKFITVIITGKGNYTGQVTRSYQITPRTVALVSGSNAWTYDGKDHSEPSVTVAEGCDGFVDGEGATYGNFATVKDVVEGADNTFDYTLNDGTLAGNYEITKEPGKLTVTENSNEIVVTTVGGTYTYDGQPHGATVTVSNLPEGYTLEAASSSASVVDANAFNNGDKGVDVTADNLVVRNNAGEDVTSKLNIKKIDGKLAVTPARIVVNTPNATKVYDGSALTAEGSISGLVNHETVDFKTIGSQTEQGTSDNSYELNWTGTAKQSNYTVEQNVGTLEVTKQSITPGSGEQPDPSYKGITISDPTDSKYDGAEHKWAPTVTDANGNALAEGADYAVSYDKADFTDAGTITVTIKGAGNYTGTVVKTYVISKAPVTIATDSADKVYDGTALTAGGTISGIVEGETVDFAATGSQTTVGSSENTYRLAWTGTAKESNYVVTSVETGTLTVKENESDVVVTTVGGTYVYDGQPHGATVTVSALPQGYTLETASSSASATDVNGEGIAATADTLVIRNVEGQDVTANLNIVRNDGIVKVTPAQLTVATDSASKVYDGSAITAGGSVEGFVNGEEATFATTGSQTEVGESPNDYKLTFDKSAKKDNYVIGSEQLGTLSVSAQSITPGQGDEPNADYKGVTVSDPSDEVYDNAAHQWSPVVTDANGNVLIEGVDYEVSYGTDDFVNVGEIAATITGIGNYKGSVVKTYRITPAELTVATGSATKTYDGTALTSSELRIDGLKGSDAVAARTTGEQTEIGSSENTYTIDWREVNPDNYTITEQLGTLTVEPAPVVPNTDNNGGDNGNGGNGNGGTTPGGATDNGNGGTTPAATPANNGGAVPGANGGVTTANAAPAGPIEAIAQVLESGYEAVTGDTSASAPEEQIYDEENPLGKAEPVTCWVHFYMILGMLLTVLYGALVWLRRGNHTRKLKSDMNDILGGDDKDSKESPVATSNPATEA